MDLFKRLSHSITAMWQNLSATHRAVVSILASLAGFCIVWGAWVAADPGMVRVVGIDVRKEDRAQILAKLEERGQPYELRSEEIYLPRKDADRVVLELAGEGILSDQILWKFIEASDPTVSKYQNEKRDQIALQRKLVRMIRAIEGVRNASVQITSESEARIMNFQGESAKASVQVELRPDMELSRQNVMAIAGLVAHAVKGLPLDQVHIMDTRGRAYRVPKPDDAGGTASGLRDAERVLEEDIKTKILGLFPDAKIAVAAMATPATRETFEEAFDQPKAAREEDYKHFSIKASHVPAVGIKAEGDASLQGAPPFKEEVRESQGWVVNTFNRKTSKAHHPAGSIEKVGVAVILPVETGEDVAEARQRLSEARALEGDVKEVVLAMLRTRADAQSVKVMTVPSRRPPPLIEAGLWSRFLDWLDRSWTSLLLFALSALGLGLMVHIAKAALPKNAFEELAALKARMMEAVTVPATIPEDLEVNEKKRDIQAIVLRNPRSVAGILKRWLMGKKR